MKKITLILMAAFLVVTVGSCTQDETPNNNNNNGNENTFNDGVYKPGKNIGYCYEWNEWLNERMLTEVWNWNGTKLESIDHMTYSGDISWTEALSYQGDRVDRVEKNGSEYESTEYTYDGNHLSKVSFYYNNILEILMTFSYGGNGRVSQIKAEIYDTKALTRGFVSQMKPYFPKSFLDRMEEHRGDMEHDESFTLKIQWTGENISRMELVSVYSGNNYSVTCSDVYTFEFDAKKNPKQGLLGLYTFDESVYDLNAYYSKNNITYCRNTYREYGYEGDEHFDEEETQETEFIYQYDGADFPAQISRTHHYTGGDYNTYTYYYEYL